MNTPAIIQIAQIEVLLFILTIVLISLNARQLLIAETQKNVQTTSTFVLNVELVVPLRIFAIVYIIWKQLEGKFLGGFTILLLMTWDIGKREIVSVISVEDLCRTMVMDFIAIIA